MFSTYFPLLFSLFLLSLSLCLSLYTSLILYVFVCVCVWIQVHGYMYDQACMWSWADNLGDHLILHLARDRVSVIFLLHTQTRWPSVFWRFCLYCPSPFRIVGITVMHYYVHIFCGFCGLHLGPYTCLSTGPQPSASFLVNFLVSNETTLDYRRNPVGIFEFQVKTRIYPCFLLLSIDNPLTKGFRKKELEDDKTK